MTDRWRLQAVILTLVTLASAGGCGSGSSGFDLRSIELAAIVTSAQTGTCKPAPGGVEVCAMNADVGMGALCDAVDDECRFATRVALQGLDPGSMVIGAVEPEDLSLPWRTSSNVLGPANAAGELSGELFFVTDIPPGTLGLRALLIYPPNLTPPILDGDGLSVELLADLSSPFADVLVGWPIEEP